MRALVCVLSVRMPIWAPVMLIALCPSVCDRHRHQRHAHLLAGRQQHVHFPRRRLVGDLLGQVDEHVRVVAHRADHHHHLVVLQRARIALRAAARIFWLSATLVPPNFCTMRDMAVI